MTNKIIFSLAAASVILIALIFVYHFYFDLKFILSEDAEDWAQFGDYFGGILNPILSFFAIVLLIKSIDMQMLANRVLREELDESKKNEKIKNFESLFFNMLDRQNSALPLIFVEEEIEGSKLKICGIDVFIKLEEIVFDLLDDGINIDDISEKIESFDSHDSIYSQFRCFYLSVSFIEDCLSDEKGFSKSDRKKYYKALINFTDFSQIKIMAMFLQFMYQKYDNVKNVRSNKEFEEVFLSSGLSFDIYKK